MPFKNQKDKWFTVLIFLALPFYVLFRLLKRKLPPLSQVGPPKK
ncbi:MAG: hypothetical protein PHT44_02165 [Candidatus Portnoybacteria bacterium]|nr:hypothetical protein [Candidatus Portnoybacteria bacterium]MDD4982601.1 hypothetical protein [Candidatus Portnoybacteria bacterium]